LDSLTAQSFLFTYTGCGCPIRGQSLIYGKANNGGCGRDTTEDR
jgi:hypothetical protein